MQIIDDKTASRFWSHVVRGPEEQCWQWTGGKRFRVAGCNSLPRRVAFLASGGSIPTRHFRIVALCRNPLCVNPHHLRCEREWSRRNRSQRGSSVLPISPINPLEEDRLRARFAAGVPLVDLARELNIPVKSVRRIVKGEA